MLDWVPAQLRVVRITLPKYACRMCGTVAQAAAPERPITGGLATPALLAQVLIAKYCDHTPLYRQSQIFAWHGVDLARSTLAGWVGRSEEHTSELQSLMRHSHAGLCLKKQHCREHV